MGLEPGEGEGDLLALAHRQLGHRAHVLTVRVDPREKCEGVGARGGRQEAVMACHPRHHVAVAEPDAQLHAQGHLAAHALDDAHHLGVVLTYGHAVGQPHDALGRLELGLEHERALPVAPPHGGDLTCRRDAPEPVVLGAEQGREARPRVEVREAQPVDRAVGPDKGCGAKVADDGVLLDRQGHGAHSYRLSKPRTGSARGARPRAHRAGPRLGALHSGEHRW